tara:strand:+ start:112 stop:681 length:570 start_codon:yes stop_codon:yes gene_type:complete
MGTLEWVHDLWSPLKPDELQPTSALVAQTSGGVVNAVHAFVRSHFSIDCATHFITTFDARRVKRLGIEAMTFKEEFLQVSRQLIGGFIVVSAGEGNVVQSIDTWQVGQPSARALTGEQARKLFAEHTTTIVISPDRITCFTHADRDKTPLLLDNPPPPPPPPPPVSESRALIDAARGALSCENWALRPV